MAQKEFTQVVEYTVSDVSRIHSSCHVAKGEINSIGHKTTVSIVGYPQKADARLCDNLSYDFPYTIPSLPVKYMHGDSVVALGHHFGTSLHNFINKVNGHFWDYDSTGKYFRPAKVFRNLGRAVGSLIHRLHRARLCLGGKFMHVIFVSGDGVHTPFSLRVMGPVMKYRKEDPESSFVDGVWNDLVGLVEFVKHVQLVKKKNVARRGAQTDDTFDLRMFYALMPKSEEEKPRSEEKMMELSYFICHTSLFWDYGQRFAFCSSYYQLREQGSIESSIVGIKAFDNMMDFEKYTEMVNWHTKVERKKVNGADLGMVFKNEKKLYKMNKGLIPFYRNALVHCVKDTRMRSHQANMQTQASDIDEELVKCFPFAMPIAYFEIYKTFSKVKDGIVQFLCAGGLDYSQYEM